jgi:class 3 adenylate cyclase
VCGRPLPDGARFCPNCGASVGPLVGTEERKMVTVLFADIVDSTGHGRRLDPERSREVLGQFFDATAKELLALRGRPEKFIGDAVMAVFGLPTVHEDDALRAVRAGLAIRDRTRRLGEEAGLSIPLEVRIGIESGEAAMGRNPSGQVLVTGQAVNVAERLQARPDPRRANHACPHDHEGLLRAAPPHPCQRLRCFARGLSGRGPLDALRTANDSIRRPRHRAGRP